jgi:TRAP transporter TAXI family solute receptor
MWRRTIGLVTTMVGALLLISVLPTSVVAQQKQFFSFGSSPSGTSQYIYAGMLIGMARPLLPNVAFNNEAVSGTGQNLDLLRRGEIALGVASPERLYAAHHGLESYKDKKVPTSIMWVMNEQAALLFSKQDSAIKSFRDLKGKKVNIGPAGSSNEIKNAFILEAYGFTRKEQKKSDFTDVQTVKLTHQEAANALAEGAIDAMIATQPVPDPSIAEVAFRIPLHVIPVDQDMFSAVRKIYPWLWPFTVAANSFRGQEKELLTLGDPNYIVAHPEKLPEKVAYDLTKAYVEKLLKQMATQADYLRPYAADRKRLISPWVIPGHPGAVKYYEEIGLHPEVTK